MACKCKRYDAWGNVILPHKDMLAYYRDDSTSLAIVQKLMPHRYYVLPDVSIRLDPKNPDHIQVDLVYPGGVTSKTVELSKRALCALRKTYKGRKGWTVRVDKYGWIVFAHRGAVRVETAGKYQVRTPVY